jgi:hypothetical protein
MCQHEQSVVIQGYSGHSVSMVRHRFPGRTRVVVLFVGAALGWCCTDEVRSPAPNGSAGGGGQRTVAGTAGGGGLAAGGGGAGAAGGRGAGGTAGITAAAGQPATGGSVGTGGDAGMAGSTAGTGGAAGMAGSTAGTGGAAGASGTASGTIVPLYTYPSDASWTAIVTAKQAHQTVHVVAVVNPSNGPGSSKASAYTTGIAKLVAANIQVIGYVATGYASHSLASMQGAIDQWKAFYPQIQGIFFDEQSAQAADVAYYRTLSQYAKAQGLPYTVGNPGADTAEAFVGALDTMLIYESKGLPALSNLAGWHAKHAPTNFGVIPYGTAFDASFVQEARKYVGYIYLQNDDLPNPWDTLPAYFGDLLAALE